jgi:hypothetical protein
MKEFKDLTFGDLSIAACKAEMHAADKIGVEWRFHYRQWVEWWIAQLNAIGAGAQRGRLAHQYVMARHRDQGAYEPFNVSAVHPASDGGIAALQARQDAAAKATATRAANGVARGFNLKQRGYGHPRSKPVTTPAGTFGSLALAAEHHGITRQGAQHRVRRGTWMLAQ